MSSYTAIADISNAIIGLLSDHMVPEVVSHGSKIFLGCPGDNHQASLYLWLYDAREEQGVRMSAMVNEGLNRQRYPSLFFSLYYMVTAVSTGDARFRAAEEQKIMGRAMQVLKDYSIMHHTTYQVTEDNRPEHIRISLLDMPQEEKHKIFNFPNTPYKISAFYRVSPVEVPSAKEKEISRVTELRFQYSGKEQ